MMVITDSTLTREETQHKEQRRQKKEAELGSGVAGAAEYSIQGRKQGLGLPVALTLMKICSASFSLFFAIFFSSLSLPSSLVLCCCCCCQLVSCSSSSTLSLVALSLSLYVRVLDFVRLCLCALCAFGLSAASSV
jgi:hypothetical protein